MIDPFDEIDREKTSLATRLAVSMKELYEIFFSVLKLGLVTSSLVIFILLIIMMVLTEEGIVIQPFESNEEDLSSIFIANQLAFKLQNIKEINKERIEMPGFEIVGSDFQTKSESMPSLLLEEATLEYKIKDLGNVGVGGTSFSLGDLILSLKHFLGRSRPVLSGSIQASGSELIIISILNDRDISNEIIAWEIRKDLTNNTTVEDMHEMIEDLSYQIAATYNKKRNPEDSPQRWQTLKYCTLSREAYYNYNITNDIIYLNNSRNYAIKAMKSEPNYSEIPMLFSILGSAYLKLNITTDAEQLFKNATELDESSGSAWEGLGLARFLQANYPGSIEAYEQAIKHSDDNSGKSINWYNRGNAFYRLGNSGNNSKDNYSEAIESYNKALNFSQDNIDALFNKGLAFININKPNEAILAFEDFTNKSKNDSRAWYNKGVSYHDARRYDEAIHAYKIALNLNESYGEAWCGISKAYIGKNQVIKSKDAKEMSDKLDYPCK
ncbi:MAG: tetratricopeptide repeat protein [Methanothrix sp.]